MTHVAIPYAIRVIEHLLEKSQPLEALQSYNALQPFIVLAFTRIYEISSNL
jgi:hypothetical protein